MKAKSRSVVLIVLSLISTAVFAGENVVGQKDKKFVGADGKPVASIKVKVGDKIDFRNEDPFFHNVFSLSDIQMFDLGSYPKGEGRKVTFEKPGVVDVECSIHPEMQLKVEVSK